jgi:hypothetical protein
MRRPLRRSSSPSIASSSCPCSRQPRDGPAALEPRVEDARHRFLVGQPPAQRLDQHLGGLLRRTRHGPAREDAAGERRHGSVGERGGRVAGRAGGRVDELLIHAAAECQVEEPGLPPVGELATQQQERGLAVAEVLDQLLDRIAAHADLPALGATDAGGPVVAPVSGGDVLADVATRGGGHRAISP